MNIKFYTLIIFFSSLFLKINAQCTWEEVNTPSLGAVICFEKHQKWIFAGSTKGLYRSSDNGLSWQVSGSSNMYINSIHSTGDRLFYGSNRGVFISKNNGDSWEKLNIHDMFTANRITHFDSTILVTTQNKIFKSTNKGISWVSVPTPKLKVNSFIESTIIRHDTIIILYQFGPLYRSCNLGETWTLLRYSNEVQDSLQFAKRVLTWDNNSIFFNSGKYLFESNNGGDTWLKHETPTTSFVRAYIKTDTTFIISSFPQTANSEPLLYKKEVTGWQAANGLDGVTIVSSIYRDTGNILLIGTFYRGIYKSLDGGKFWFPSTQGIKPLWNHIGKFGKKFYIGNLDGLYSSNNQGKSWEDISVISKHFHRFVGTEFLNKVKNQLIGSSGREIYYRTEKGGKWIERGIPRDSNDFITKAWIGEHIFLGLKRNSLIYNPVRQPDTAYIIKSSDNGQTWVKADSGLSSRNPITGFGFNGRDYFVASKYIYKSTNKGLNWQKVSNSTLKDSVSFFCTFKKTFFVIMHDQLYISKDDGVNWNKIYAYSYPNYINCIQMDNDVIFLGIRDKGIQFSNDNGKTWKPVKIDLKTPNVIDIVIEKNNFWILTNDGLFKIDKECLY